MEKMRYIIPLCCLLVIFSLPSAFARNTDVVMVLFGDGMFSANDLPKNRSLAEQIQGQYDYLQVINSSVRNISTKTAIGLIEDKVAKYNPDIIMIGLGTSDFYDKIEIAKIRFNLETVLWNIRKNNPTAKMILVKMHVKSDNYKLYDLPYHNMFEAIANKYQIPLYADFTKVIAGKKMYLQGNYFFPNGGGIAEILEDFKPYYDSYVRQAYAEKLGTAAK